MGMADEENRNTRYLEFRRPEVSRVEEHNRQIARSRFILNKDEAIHFIGAYNAINAKKS
jgi:hypothetical protein